jgi:hypothetical protein
LLSPAVTGADEGASTSLLLFRARNSMVVVSSV